LKFVNQARFHSPVKQGRENGVAHALLPLRTISQFPSSRRTGRLISQRAALQVEVRNVAMKTTQMARRFVITSLLALLVPIVLFTPQAYAESYVAGQLGATFPGNGLSNGDLTTTTVPFSTGTLTIPSGTTVSDQSLKTSFMVGGKIGHYFSRARWFGLEAEIFFSTPHIKQQNITFRSDAPITFTPSGGPSTPLGNEFTAAGVHSI